MSETAILNGGEESGRQHEIACSTDARVLLHNRHGETDHPEFLKIFAGPQQGAIRNMFER